MIRTQTDKRISSIMLVITATLLWSSGAPIAKYIESPVTTLIFFRCLSGFTLLWAVYLFQGRKHFLSFDTFSITGGIMYALNTGFFYSSLKFTTAANTTVIANTTPFFIAFFSYIFLREKPNKSDWLILSIIISGLFLCFMGGVSLQGTNGDFLALGASVSFALLAIIIKKSDPKRALQPILWGNIFAVIATAPGLMAADSLIISDVPFFIILGIFQMVIPFFLYAKGQRNLGTMESSLYKLFEPVAATLWVALLIGEIPPIYTFIGGAMVLAALFFKTLREYRYSLNKKYF